MKYQWHEITNKPQYPISKFQLFKIGFVVWDCYSFKGRIGSLRIWMDGWMDGWMTVTSYKLRVTNYELRVSDFGFRVSDWSTQNSKFKTRDPKLTHPLAWLEYLHLAEVVIYLQYFHIYIMIIYVNSYRNKIPRSSQGLKIMASFWSKFYSLMLNQGIISSDTTFNNCFISSTL